ncbi:MAG: hypothetical protein HC892_21865 [Saprospiraceae bacterium]|nr:hypothetical protein [Saprospiraceae bacterium]
MKKSTSIVLGLTITMSACYSDRKPPSTPGSPTAATNSSDWTYGNDAPDAKDTMVNGNAYRRHYGMYYPIIGGLIAPRLYQGGSMSQISSPSYRPITQPSYRDNNGSSAGSGGSRGTGEGATSRGGFGGKGSSGGTAS